MKFTLEKTIPKDQQEILDLAELVNETHVIPVLDNQGKKTMRNARKTDILQVTNKEIYSSLKAVNNQEIIGYIAWKQGNYIAQLYVKSQYQGHGVGKKLIKKMQMLTGANIIHLKASINAIGFYTKLGFIATSKEQNSNGIRYIPMQLTQEL